MEQPIFIPDITTLYIKNIVCPRCIRLIRELLTNLGLPVVQVSLGQVDLAGPLQEAEKEAVKVVLADYGFSLLEERKARLVEQIKSLLIDLIYYKEDKITSNYSTYLAESLGKDYGTLSHTFSAEEGITIEKYVILLKVEYIKAELEYDELSLGEIAARLQYSSLSHLSKQFKNITGIKPSEYKKSLFQNRKPLDLVK